MIQIEATADFYTRFKNEMINYKDYELVINDLQQMPSIIEPHYEIIAIDLSCPAAKVFEFNENDLMHSTWIILDTTIGTKVKSSNLF